MMSSYRTQAERRACMTRPHVPGARTAGARTPLELPPWGYGAGRPAAMFNSSQRLFRRRMRSASSPAKQTNSCCETGPALQPVAAQCSRPEHAAPSNRSNSTTYGRDGADLGVVVELRSAESSAEKSRPKPSQMSWNAAASSAMTAAGVPTQHAYVVGGVHCVGDTAMTGGGPVVTSSSMETWTTYEDGTSSSPLVQSTISTPHNVASPKLDSSTANTPSSPPQPPLATSWSGRLSPKSQTSLTDATKVLTPPASPSSGSPRLLASTTQPTADEAVTVVAQEVISTVLSQSPAQKKVASSASGEVAVDTAVVSPTGSKDGKGPALRRVSPRTDPRKSPSATSKASDQDKSSLMVGLVKVKSRDTGLMIDCPILETLYTNEPVESSSPAARQTSSHKVVLIKAVVPRWAWNGRAAPRSPASSSQASPSSTRTNDSKLDKRKSLVSVNTQTSDTLLPVRRTISEHRAMPPTSPTPVADASMYVPAVQDECQLAPSPKLPACFARWKTAPRTPPECNVRSPKPSGRVLSSPNNSSLLSSLLMMSRKPKESESVELRPPASMEYDSLMEDRLENLKLDLQFSSSGNNSDSDSVTHKKTAAGKHCNHSSSSSSEDLGSMSGQGLPRLNWSCAATAATASSEAVVSLKTSAGYVDEMAGSTTPSSAAQQKPPSAGRPVRISPTTSQRRSAASTPDADDSARHRGAGNGKCQPSPRNSPRSDAKTRLTPDGCSQRSPCPWRSSTSNIDVEEPGWTGLDFSCRQDAPQQYDHDVPSPQQLASSRSESSTSARSKSTSHDCYYEMSTNQSTSATMSPGCLRTEPRATLPQPPPGQLLTSGESDTCAAEPPADASMRRRHHHHDEFRSAAAAGVKPTSHHQSSKRDCRRSIPATKHHRSAVEPKSLPHGRYNVTTSKMRPGDSSQRKYSSAEARRRGDAAQTSRSTGSVAVQRNTSATKRQHPSSASRHASRSAAGGANRRSSGRDVHAFCTADRRTSSSRERDRSVRDVERRGRRSGEKHSASCEPRSDRKTATSTTRSGRRQRQSTDASVSKSVGSVSRDRPRPQSAHARHFAPVRSASTQPKHADNSPSRRAARESTLSECRQGGGVASYCSPRSHRPFPPPISDRCPPASTFDSSTAAAVAATALTGEPVAQYVIVQRQEDDGYAGDRHAGARDDCPPPPARHHERLHRPVQTGIDQQRRRVSDGGTRRRKQLPATPQTWSHELPVRVKGPPSSVAERPAWKQYFA